MLKLWILGLVPLVAAAEPSRPLHGNHMNDRPEIERVKLWRPILKCADGRVTIDSAITHRSQPTRVDPKDPVNYLPFRNWMSNSDLLRNDLQMVIRDRRVIEYLDSFTVRDFQSYYYASNWDLLRSSKEVKTAAEADELVIRGSNKTRIWSIAEASQVAFGAGIPDYIYATNHPFFKGPGTHSRAMVYREGKGVRVQLVNFYPFTEIAEWYFDNCQEVK